MRDEATVLTDTAAPSRPLPATSTPASRVKLLPLQKLTRAHLAASTRPQAIAGLNAAMQGVVEKLAAQLKTRLECRATLRPSTLHPFSHLAANSLFALFELGGEAIGVLELDALGTGALIGHLTGLSEAAGIPQSLSSIEQAALSWVALSSFAELRNQQAFHFVSPRLLAVTLDRGEVLRQLDGRRRHVAIELALKLGETNALGRVLLPALWVQSKLELMPSEAAPEALPELQQTALPFACLVGGALLSQHDAKALTAGDVILFEGVRAAQGRMYGVTRLIGRSFELRGTFSEAGFTLNRAVERPTQESAMSSVDPSMPVEVEIELTRLRIPLHQLGAIRPGAVVPLHINAAQHVLIRIGDKAVARAELVEIEGEIGARVVSML